MNEIETYSENHLHCMKNVRIRAFPSQYFFSILQSKSPYSVPMRENMDQKNYEYGHFLCSVNS